VEWKLQWVLIACQGYLTYLLSRSSAYLGRDFPQRWFPLDLDLEEVHMPREDSVHYTMNTPLGTAEWQTLLPSGDGFLYLGPSHQQFSIAMFHQLRCLNVVRGALASIFERPELATPNSDDQPAIVRHCMDYLRQMTLCHADLTMLNVKSIHRGRGHVKDSDNTHRCKAFNTIYDAAEENYAQYQEMVKNKGLN
jgi:hypothetical protein